MKLTIYMQYARRIPASMIVNDKALLLKIPVLDRFTLADRCYDI